MNRLPIEFTKKPTRAMIMRSILQCIPHGIRGFDLAWGENWIELEYYHGQWHGCGWIKAIGGDDIASDLNKLAA